MPSLGSLNLFVVEERPIYSNQITSKPVEAGEDISDHIEKQSVSIALTIVVTGQKAQDVYEKLISMRNSQEVFDYQGVQRKIPYKNMAIESFNPSKTKDISKGFRASLQLKQIRIPELKTMSNDFESFGKDPSTGDQVQGPPSDTEEREAGKEEIKEETKTSILNSFFNSILRFFRGDQK